MASSKQRFISIPEAGRRLSLSARTVRRLVDRGQLTAIEIPGTHPRVVLDEVEALIPPALRTCPTCGKPGYSSQPGEDQPSREQGKKPVRGRPFPKGTSGNPLGRPPLPSGGPAPVASRR
jgi:excisionase family DNA binding protein